MVTAPALVSGDHTALVSGDRTTLVSGDRTTSRLISVLFTVVENYVTILMAMSLLVLLRVVVGYNFLTYPDMTQAHDRQLRHHSN